jgi:uncharacterized protein YqiB (DUF1249 family)
MTQYTEQQRQELVNQLKDMKFSRATGKLRRLDKNARLVYYRSSQGVGRWMTRYDLPNLGTRVTLVEENQNVSRNDKLYNDWQMVEVIAEPLENRS